MATFYYELSKKEDSKGFREILVRLRNGNDYDLRAHTKVFITKHNFDRKSGIIVSNKIGNDTELHKKKRDKLTSLCDYIRKAIQESEKEDIKGSWLKDRIKEFYNNGKKKENQENACKSFANITEEFINERIKNKKMSPSLAKDMWCAARVALRYEAFRRETEDKNFSFNIDSVTKDDVEGLIDYFRNESNLQKEYPETYKRILSTYPNGRGTYGNRIQQRGNNTLIKKMERIRTIFKYAIEKGYITKNPFFGISLGQESYKTEPIYLTLEERDTIANANLMELYNQRQDKRGMGIKYISNLSIQRDIFLFQCYVGCRVSDLKTFTENNIVINTEGVKVLVYTPKKTARKTGIQARVPLKPKALELIEKYKGVDRKGRLFPCVSTQEYNRDIKKIFSLIGITRKVEVVNPKTDNSEWIPLNEIASSHLARRTFIANLYVKVQDPNLIGKMSGHKKGSKAFFRYRREEDEILYNLVNLI